MSPTDTPLVWLRGEIKTPPFSAAVRVEAGLLLRRLQGGVKLGRVIADSRRRLTHYDHLTQER